MRASPTLMRAVATTLSLTVSAGAQSRALDVGGARINYTVTGTGPAVVLIHGWALDLREWTDQIPVLSSRFTVIALDRRGFGKSAGFADETADPGDIRALLDTLHLRSATLVGHSVGAQVALRFAAAAPERVDALVLYGGPPPDGFPGIAAGRDSAAAARRRALARQYGIDSLMKVVGAQPQFRPGPRRAPHVVARVDSIVRSYSGRDLLESHAQSNRFPAASVSAVRTWRFPILCIGGEWETRLWHQVADSMTAWLPNAHKVVIPGGGHAVHFDEPEAFNGALLNFLMSAQPAPPANRPGPPTPLGP